MHRLVLDMQASSCRASWLDAQAELALNCLSPLGLRLQGCPSRLVKCVPATHVQHRSVLANFSAPPKRLAQLLRHGQTVGLFSYCSFDKLPNRGYFAFLLNHPSISFNPASSNSIASSQMLLEKGCTIDSL